MRNHRDRTAGRGVAGLALALALGLASPVALAAPQDDTAEDIHELGTSNLVPGNDPTGEPPLSIDVDNLSPPSAIGYGRVLPAPPPRSPSLGPSGLGAIGPGGANTVGPNGTRGLGPGSSGTATGTEATPGETEGLEENREEGNPETGSGAGEP